MSSDTLPRKRIVVVLGMHRSGTSAVARGLKALGVELGERLMPAAAGNNEKGFWEDIDANTLNNDLLKHLGHSWDSLGPIDRSVLLRSDLDVFRLRAVELLREKLAGVTVFGMKDPRISRLLPFWKGAFDHVGAEVGYVISSRHPLSVARSLLKRDGMDAEKSHYLWLDHVAACMRDTEGSPRVVVDFDLLMGRTEEQLRRLAKALALPFEPSSAGFKEYAKEFLSEDLRHSTFAPEDLKPYPNIPAELVEAYALLQRMARDEVSPDAKEVKAAFAKVIHRLDEMHPAFAYINRRDVELAGLRKAAVESGERVAYLEHVVGVRDAHVTHLEQEIRTRDGHITNLQQIVGDREGRIDGLNRELARLEMESGKSLPRLRSSLKDEIALVRECEFLLGGADFQGAAIPDALLSAVASLERYAIELDGHCRQLDGCKPGSAQLQDVLAAIDQSMPAQRAAWAVVANAAGVLGLSLVESAHELEINRLRLADTLRQVSRDEDRISRLKVTVTDLQDLLARREAEIRARDAVIAERQAQVERLDGILGQVGHRFVSRIGRALAPYPGVRAVLRAPLRMLQRMSGQPGN